jgi:hypothetical protein
MDRSNLLLSYLSLLIKANDIDNQYLEQYTLERIDKVCVELDKELGISK